MFSLTFISATMTNRIMNYDGKYLENYENGT